MTQMQRTPEPGGHSPLVFWLAQRIMKIAWLTERVAGREARIRSRARGTQTEATLMRHSWRIDLALVLAVAALSSVTTANAQVGVSGASAQTVGVPASAPGGADLTGGLSPPASGDAAVKDSSARTAPPAQQRKSARFGRVTSTRREAVASAPPDVVARLGGTSAAAGVVAHGSRLHPYSAQAAQMAGTGADPRIPVGSSGQALRQPGTAPQVTMRSATHNYYPTMRPAQSPNANVPPASLMRRGGGGSGAATGMMMRNMLGGTQRQAARNGQIGSPGRGQAGPAPGRR